MASRKRQKYPAQKKTLTDARRFVIRNGDYNGSSSSSDFMVSGHSTGSPFSEMEELSQQVTRDAGGVGYQEPIYADDRSDTGYEMYQGEGLGDLGGPELYGDRYAPKAPRTSRGLMIGAAVGLAATALLGGLAYLVYQSEEKRSNRRGAGTKTLASGLESGVRAGQSRELSESRSTKTRGAATASKRSSAKSRNDQDEIATKSRSTSGGRKRSSAQARA